MNNAIFWESLKGTEVVFYWDDLPVGEYSFLLLDILNCKIKEINEFSYYVIFKAISLVDNEKINIKKDNNCELHLPGKTFQKAACGTSFAKAIDIGGKVDAKITFKKHSKKKIEIISSKVERQESIF